MPVSLIVSVAITWVAIFLFPRTACAVLGLGLAVLLDDMRAELP